MRASYYLLPAELRDSLYNKSSYEEVSELTEHLQQMAFDFCTSALQEILTNTLRATRKPVEDVIIGLMDKNTFFQFMKVVHEKATNFIGSFKSEDIEDYMSRFYLWLDIKEDDFKLTDGMDWIHAYFTCAYLYKTINWNTYLVYFTID